MTCLHFHSNTETWSDVYTHTVICTQRWTRAHTVNLVTNSQVHSLTVTYMDMINIHTYTYTHAMTQKQMYTLRIWHKWTWLYIHSQVNMLPAWTCLQIHSYVWTQKNTLTHWYVNRLNSLLHKEMPTYLHRLHIHSNEHAHRFISVHRQSVVPWFCSGKGPTCQWRRCKRHWFDPWVRKIPWRRKWEPTPVLLPGKFHGSEEPGRLHGVTNSQTGLRTEHTHIDTLTHGHVQIKIDSS